MTIFLFLLQLMDILDHNLKIQFEQIKKKKLELVYN